ncbi:NUDIX hydrolase [Treponema sp. TIM-1]|uniref:NUDIX hydrolase n=1 Tax=Treponema sp. TIM-1 TaxID=2898417 RepID=UPI00398071F9
MKYIHLWLRNGGKNDGSPDSGQKDTMDTGHLIWKEQSRKQVFTCPVFSIHETSSLSPEGERKGFTVLEAADWAIVIPVVETEQGKAFVMVRQWRHGSRELSLEFPGGVVEPGEDPAAAAARELEEETAYAPGKIRKIGEMRPNPALMSNRVHFFLAESLEYRKTRHLDEDEYIAVEIIPENEALKDMGSPPYVHALMASALGLYLLKR